MMHKSFLYVARANRAPIFLPEGYKKRTNTVVKGQAKTGEISDKGLVSETEDWDGRTAAKAAPATIRYVRDPDGRWRPMTLKEMVDRGLFILGEGPKGVRNQEEGIKND